MSEKHIIRIRMGQKIRDYEPGEPVSAAAGAVRWDIAVPEGKLLMAKARDQITVGRGKTCDIVLGSPMVSRMHCRFLRKDGRWYLEDAGSTNGTYVNDCAAGPGAVPLSESDLVKIDCYRLKVTDESVRVLNADERAALNIPAYQMTAREAFCPEPYPYFSRSPRSIPEFHTLELSIEAAPAIGEKPSVGMAHIAFSVPMLALSLGMQALRYGLGKRKYSKDEQARNELYARYLSGVEEQLKAQLASQAEYEDRMHPTVLECVKKIQYRTQGLWARRPQDPDFLSLRIGTASVPAAVRLRVPEQHLSLKEDPLAGIPGQLKEKYALAPDVPVSVSLIADGNLGVVGSAAGCAALCRNFILQLAALQSCDEVKLVLLYPKEQEAEYAWARWLPHCQDDSRQVRYLVWDRYGGEETLRGIERTVRERLDRKDVWNPDARKEAVPHYVFLAADPGLITDSAIGTALMREDPSLGVSGIFFGRTPGNIPNIVKTLITLPTAAATDISSLLKAGNPKLLLTRGGSRLADIVPDTLPLPGVSESVARMLAPVRLRSEKSTGGQAFQNGISLFEALKIRDPREIEYAEIWERAVPERSLAVPIGVRADGSLFSFDIHEKAQGPHGFAAGDTGSGKSKMMQSWILSMAMHYSPEQVNFMLVDFKGDSLLQPLRNLPHLAGAISNLSVNVARCFSALESEMFRRQRILSRFSCSDNLDYLKKRRSHPDWEPMPFLFAVIDEFAEFKVQFPDFEPVLKELYRQGRSAGIYLILMTQNPDGVINDQITSNSRFRWCLRMQSESNSRSVIGIPDAAGIRNPGRAFVKSGDGTLELIQSLYCGGPYRRGAEDVKTLTVSTVAMNGARRSFRSDSGGGADEDTEVHALPEAIAEYCRKKGIRRAKPLWTEELPETVDLMALLRSQTAKSAFPKAVLGTVDDPARQSQYPFIHDFTEEGNLAVYGMPQSGKTTFLRTLIQSLCLSASPKEIQIYILGFGSFGAWPEERFPHTGAMAAGNDRERAGKMIGLLSDELGRRRALFHKNYIGSFAAYFDSTGEKLPMVLLVIDRLDSALSPGSDFNTKILELTGEGPAYGIYTAAAFGGTYGVNGMISQNFRRKAALRLSDKGDYFSIVGKPGGVLPKDVPGSGLIASKERDGSPLLFQTAILFPEETEGMRGRKLLELAEQAAAAYRGPRAAGIRSMPETVAFDPKAPCYTPGLDEKTVLPVTLKEADTLSMLISCENEKQKQELAELLIRQTKQAGGRVFYWTSGSGTGWTEPLLKDGDTAICGTEMLDKRVESLADILRERQARRKQDPAAVFPPILMLLDGLKAAVEGCREETVMRLEVIIRLGQGLHVTLAAADTAENAASCRNRGDILTMTLRKGPMLLCGGNLSIHQAADPHAARMEHPKPLGDDEICLIKGQDPVFLKRMRPR